MDDEIMIVFVYVRVWRNKQMMKYLLITFGVHLNELEVLQTHYLSLFSPLLLFTSMPRRRI